MSMEDYDYYAYINATSEEYYAHEMRSELYRIFIVCLYSIACIFGIPGNALVLTILIFCEKVKVPTDIFLVSLAVADLLFLCTLPFWAYSAAKEWIFGTLSCKIIRGLYSMNLYGSMLTLTCITIDRYFAIVQATKAHISQAKRKVWGTVFCIVVWVVSLAFALPQLIFSIQEKLDKEICYTAYSSHNTKLLINIIQVLLGFFCPMLVMVICYSIIVHTLCHARGFHKHKSLQIIFAIVVTFIFTQTPYNLLKLFRTINKESLLDYSSDYVFFITEAIAYFHSCLNPVLYFFIGAKFRKNLAKILKNMRCAKHHQIMKQWQTTDEDGSKTGIATNNVEETSMYPL
ncbi:C-X-C chemokine receptor type 6 [Varanus komodoensis]|uniref:C-X-C chemokine receptor type 6 n=1 Tax=Varanus komodoensis TaxID=61221 RepID=UPI001CF78D99|nr:C-X-C chemokine receptor type 6 [Varanus komodoensis]KAF7247710.1 C-X-C chemokine receptor type 6 [Varanus komodoensis]